MKKNTLGVALVKEACPLCIRIIDGPILMNTKLSVSRAKEVEALHGQCIGYAIQPCDQCKSLMEKGFLLIQCDESKTDDKQNPWRTGKQCVIKREAAKQIFGKDHMVKGAAFLTIETWTKIGLP